MKIFRVLVGVLGFVLLGAAAGAAGSGLPVSASRPRVLVTSADVASLQAKVAGNDPAWLALKADADRLAGYAIFPYVYANRTTEPDNTIFYDYQGSGWFEAAMPLGLAYLATGNEKYSNQLIALADEMIAAQTRPENQPPDARPPLEPDSYYPTRYLGPTIAILYDWCYPALGASRRQQLSALMTTYFDDMRANAYQIGDQSDGNYFVGHMIAAGWMGYASFGDNPRAQEMIDFARIRFDGTESPDVAPADRPAHWFSQCFDGGILSAVAAGYNGIPDIVSAPFLGGFDFQAWSYGSGTYERVIDYLRVVRSATGEDLFSSRVSWFSQIFRALKEATFGDGFRVDPSGDWGGEYGATVPQSLALRLAAVLAGSADGSGAQHYWESEISHTAVYPDGGSFSFAPEAWESVLYDDPSRPSQALALAPFHSGFAQSAPLGSNGAIPYFLFRSDWTPTATWGSATMGAQYYDDHQHKNFGHVELVHGQDDLLVDASQWMGDAGSSGIVGGCNEADNASSANTLFFDDYGDFMYTGESQYYGGQGDWGIDQVTAAEQNDDDTFVRSDLSTAYNAGSDQTAQGNRSLARFSRSFLYLRASDLVVVYDRVAARHSTDPRGEYRKHLRWHFPNQPSIFGRRVTVAQGQSRLVVDTVLPPSPLIVAVDESKNPDDLDPDFPDQSLDSGTWRVEVNGVGNPLEEEFLTVFEPGSSSRPAMTTARLASAEGAMAGALIAQPSGVADVVLFSTSDAQVPPPIDSVSYPFTGPAAATHTLSGMRPGARYDATWDGANVSVGVSASGAFGASSAGVLRLSFDPAALGRRSARVAGAGTAIVGGRL